MNVALKCDGKTPDDSDLLNSSWRQHVHIVLQKIRWKWVCGALLVRKFADGTDDVIIGEDAKSRKLAV